MNTISAADRINALLTEAGHATITRQAIADRLSKMVDDGMLPASVRTLRSKRTSWDLFPEHCRLVADAIIASQGKRKKKKPSK